MPHGGGHHGGGGGGHHGGHHGGGGGHHGGGGGGGFHHHHHHHNHHRRHAYYGAGGGYYYYGRRPLTWVVFSVVVIIALLLSTVLSVRYTASDYRYDDGLHYAPTDTRIIPVSNALCQGLELTVTDSTSTPYSYTASLFMLDSPPKLTGHETFSFTTELYLDSNDYQHYYYYMYPGSNFTVSACIEEGYSGLSMFYLIKGNKNLNKWEDDPYSVPTEKSFQISTQCNSGINTTKHTYKVKKEDYYYLVFDADHGLSTRLSIDLSFHRTLYEMPANVSVDDSCSVSTEFSYASCSVNVPMSGQTAFLAITPDEGSQIDWGNDGVGLDTACVPRIWMYVIISLAILTGLVAIFLPILVCIIVRLRKINKNAPSTVAATSEPRAPLLSNPPPANPHFQQAPGYGSNYTAPPQYKA